MICCTMLKKMVGVSIGIVIFQNCFIGGSTVDGGGLIQRVWDLLQAGEEDQHAGAELPHAHQHDDEQRRLGVAQQGHLLLDADRAQQRHKNALVAENLLPDNGNRNRAADDGRDVVQNAVDRHALVLFVQKRCHKQGKRQTQRHNHENIAEGDDHCLLEVFCRW